jgi:3-hydroxymyristoyl/3-hydroxydecanoyl-(acyl carrier protein) dehydratase
VFQVAAFFAIDRLMKNSESIDDSTPVLTKINEARFKRIVLPGSKVLLRSELLDRVGKLMMMQGSVSRIGKIDVSLKFSIAILGPQ